MRHEQDRVRPGSEPSCDVIDGAVRPLGGVHAGRLVRAWRWPRRDSRFSEPVRCRREQWYLVRARTVEPARAARIMLRFVRQAHAPLERSVELHAAGTSDETRTLLGWVQTPGDGSHVRLGHTSGSSGEASRLLDVRLFAIPERDAKCHPLAAVPAWGAIRPAFPLERLLLPASLAGLAELLADREVEIIDRPRSWRSLAQRALGSACVLEPGWLDDLNVGLREVRTLAGGSWLVLDLESTARMLRAGGWDMRTIALRHPHGVFSARVSYSDVPTRGFALEDVFPYGVLADDGGFGCRALCGGRTWKRASDALMIASILMLDGPRFEHSRHVLSAMSAEGVGEWIASDLPWLAAGALGEPLAPRLAQHAFRMLVGAPIEDGLQYWNRWDDTAVVLRDIADLPRRFERLSTVRWAADERSGAARLGLTLAPRTSLSSRAAAIPRRHRIIASGRIDQCGAHDGVAPEAMVVLMKWLARSAADDGGPVPLDDATWLTWQFETVDGLRYASHFASAADLPGMCDVRVLRLCEDRAGAQPETASGVVEERVCLPAARGVLGDGSVEFQRTLVRVVARWLQACTGA